MTKLAHIIYFFSLAGEIDLNKKFKGGDLQFQENPIQPPMQI